MSSLVLKAQICRNIATTSKSSKNPAADYRHHGPASQISHHLLYHMFPWGPYPRLPKHLDNLSGYLRNGSIMIYPQNGNVWLGEHCSLILMRSSLDYHSIIRGTLALLVLYLSIFRRRPRWQKPGHFWEFWSHLLQFDSRLLPHGATSAQKKSLRSPMVPVLVSCFIAVHLWL